MGTKLLMLTLFHPQTDGATDQANCSISQVLWALVHNSQNNWAEQVEFALNSSVSMSMGYMPFELNYGYILQLGQHLNTDMKFVSVRQFAEHVMSRNTLRLC